MNHNQQVNKIIDALLDTKYQWAIVYYTAIRHLVNTNEPRSAVCDERNRFMDREIVEDIDPNAHYGNDAVCIKCLALIDDDPVRYGFHKTGIILQEPRYGE